MHPATIFFITFIDNFHESIFSQSLLIDIQVRSSSALEICIKVHHKSEPPFLDSVGVGSYTKLGIGFFL